MARRMGWTEEKGWGDSRLLACKSPVAWSRGIHRWIRGMMRRREGRACRGDVRVEGEWVNCKTRSSVFLS